MTTPLIPVKDIVAHLTELKTEYARQTDAKNTWWYGTITIGWSKLTKGNNNCQWGSIMYRNRSMVTSRLRVSILDEIQSGRIAPWQDTDVAEANQGRAPGTEIKKRLSAKASISIQQYKIKVPTGDDDLTVVEGWTPAEHEISPYFRLAELIDEIFVAEAEARVARGAAWVASVVADVKADTTLTPTAARAKRAFNAGDIIITAADLIKVRQSFKTHNVDVLMKGAIICGNTKVVRIIQTCVSASAAKNANALLPNPITRIKIDLSEAKNATKLFDKTKPYYVDNKTKYEAAKVDGAYITENNIHKFITPRSIVDGSVIIDSICFSNMGISVTVQGGLFVIKPATDIGTDFDDIYGSGTPAPSSASSSSSSASSSSASGSSSTNSSSSTSSSSSAGSSSTSDDELLSALAGANIDGNH